MDRPIIFSSQMVRALLESRKTMTRRLLSPQPKGFSYEGAVFFHSQQQRYAVGDRLWVRESYANCKGMGFDFPYYYMADIKKGSESDELRKQYGVKWRPSIHMPREASRITLTVEAVKVERLQDISPEDAQAEGVDRRSKSVRQMWLFGATKEERDAIYLRACVWEFEQLWQSLNAKRAPWESNPWVVAPSFRVEKINIDALKAEVA